MKLKSSKKKLKASLALFIIAVIAFAVAVCAEVLLISGKQNIVWLMPVSMITYLVLITVSLLLNASYRKNCMYPGASSTALYVFQWIFFAPFVIIVVILFVVSLFCGASFPIFSSKKEKAIKIKDDKGKEYTLKPTNADTPGSEEFEDQNGDLWKTWDGGQTFEMTGRISPIFIKESQGNKLKLTPTFRGSTRFLDENGDEWWTLDGGKTYERVPKK